MKFENSEGIQKLTEEATAAISDAGPAELAALEKLSSVSGCDGIAEHLFGFVIGWYMTKGASPEEIGDAATAMARIMSQK